LVGKVTYYLHVRGKVHTGFSWGNLRESDQLEDLAIDERIILK
jgi:hypothetical protein